MQFAGAYTALVTPFRGGEIDETALRELVERQIAARIAGVVPCGSTGEGATLEPAEQGRVVRAVVEQARGRCQVIAGAGGSSTRAVAALAEQARAMGADAVMVASPPYNRPSTAGLVAHFRAVTAAARLPTVVYNIPGRTGIDVGLDVLAELESVGDVVAIKEATGNVLRAQQLLARFGSRFTVLSGDDVLTVPMMAIGARGVISVTSNVRPALVVDVVERALAGDFAAAAALHLRLLPLHEAMFLESNPGPAKRALADDGLLAPETRLPLVMPPDEVAERVQRVLARLADGPGGRGR